MFWESFFNLCRVKNKSPNAVAKELGISSGAVTSWKNGKVPHHSTLVKLADYFGVSVDFLLGRDTESDQKKEPAIENDDRLDAELIKMLCQLRSDEAGRVRDFVSGLIAARKE